MNEEVIYKFGNIQERDMDLLFMESLATDKEFAKLFLEKAKIPYTNFEVLSIALSETEPGLGESDITAIFDINGIKYGILIEDKIDAPAMPKQCDRYYLRLKKAIDDGKYAQGFVFIICPEEYKAKNEDAKGYTLCVTYEECISYFSDLHSIAGQLKCQQLAQALETAKVPTWVKDPKAMDFFKKYRNYMEQHHSTLDLRNRKDSNGWWPHYGTEYGNVYIYHKVSDKVVDLTFPKGAEKILTLRLIALWLNAHGVSNVYAVVTGKAAALRISVPFLNQHEPFENANTDDVEMCFNAIETLSNFASLLAQAKIMTS